METAPLPWLEKIIENMSDAVIILDRDRSIRLANRAAALLADVADPSILIGRSYDAIVARRAVLDMHGAVPRPETLPTYRALHDGVESSIVIEQIYKGAHYWLEVRSTPILERGVPTYAIVYFRDISQIKLHEDKLHFLIESSKILSILTDPRERLVEKARLTVPSLADWCTLNLVAENATLERIAIVHRDPAKVPLVAELADRSISEAGVVRKALETGKTQYFPRVVKADVVSPERQSLIDKLQVCSSIVLPICSSGRVVGILSLAYAESGRQYTPEDVEFFEEFCHHLGVVVENARLYDEIRYNDAAKDTFLAALSHELRNPLAPIKTALELLRLQYEDSALLEELGVIDRQFDYLTKLLNDLLDVTRYSRGKIELERSSHDLRTLLEAVARAHRPFTAKRQISLTLELPREPVVLAIDEMRLEQALANLLHNAEKFTPDGGAIMIALTHREDRVHITVRDTGIGIKTEYLTMLFDMNKTQRLARHPKSGLGLGLVLVREIARLHGGDAFAESPGEGLGSTFTLELPLRYELSRDTKETGFSAAVQ